MDPEHRQRVIDLLTESYAQDTIELEEFERRVELVEQATEAEQLEALVSDLAPGALVAPAPTPEPTSQALVPTSNKLVPAGDVPHSKSLVAIFGSVSKAHDWTVPRQLKVVSVFGGAELDLREARLGPGVTEIKVVTVFGGANILVPPDLSVEVDGVGVMGAFEHHGPVKSVPRSPLCSVRISGLAVMGGVEVEERYPGESKRQARQRKRREKKEQKQLATEQRKKLTP